MIELGLGASLFRAFGVLYWIVALAALWMALRMPKTPRRKAIAAGVVLLLFGYPVFQALWQDRLKRKQLETAAAHYHMRCQSAGEKIHRTVENVEGVFLLKLRPANKNRDDQFALDDPYGQDCAGESCINDLLYGRDDRGVPVERNATRPGYRYVDVVDPKDGVRYRYTGSIKATRRKDPTAPNIQRELQRDPNYDLNIYEFVLDRVPAPDPPPRYGVTYDDLSTREDRTMWIAGSSLRVIDLQTNEVIAERIGYMIDYGQGDKSGFRAPWLYAPWNACPPFPEAKGGGPFMGYRTRNFVERVLKVKQGE